jgi:hypothetical protein
VRLLLRAALVRLEQQRQSTFKPGLTNREYLQRFRRSPAHEPLRELVETVDVSWFGDAACSLDDYQRARTAYRSLHRQAEPEHA